jgi:hypothetical protein
MPAMLIGELLGLACVFSGGSRAERSLEGLPGPHLVRGVALGLVGLIHPHGTADWEGTVNFCVRSLRSMIRILAVQGFTGGAVRLRRGWPAEFWVASPRRLGVLTRSLLEGRAQSGGALGGGVLPLAAGRHFDLQPDRRTLPFCAEEEWQRLTAVCRSLVDDLYAAHRRALADAAEGRHPHEGGWEPGNLRRLLARVGSVSVGDFGRHLEVSGVVVRDRGGFRGARWAVFPYLGVLIACRLLFGICSGIVPDGIADLVVEGIDWAGGSTVLLSRIKRRTAGEPEPAPSGVRLLERWLAHSALLRTLFGLGGTRQTLGGSEPGRQVPPCPPGRPGRRPVVGASSCGRRE